MRRSGFCISQEGVGSQAEFLKLSPAEQKQYVRILYPGAEHVPCDGSAGALPTSTGPVSALYVNHAYMSCNITLR